MATSLRLKPGPVDLSPWGGPHKVEAIEPKDLRLGDNVIAQWKFSESAPRIYPYTMVVTKLNLPKVNLRAANGVIDTFSYAGQQCNACVELFFVTARGDEVKVQDPKDDPYPHKCPRCGRRAYVGFTSVEHYGQPAGTGYECP